MKNSLKYCFLFLVLAVGAGCAQPTVVMDAAAEGKRLRSDIACLVNSLCAKRDSLDRNVLVQKRRDSLYHCAIAEFHDRPDVYPSLLRYWADSIVDRESLLSDYITAPFGNEPSSDKLFKSVIFPVNDWRDYKTYDLDTLKLVTGWLTFSHDNYNKDYFFLLDRNKQIIDVEDRFVGSKGDILAQRFADFDGDGRGELFVKYQYFAQNSLRVYDYLFTVENNRLKIKFALIVSTIDDNFYFKQRSQYKYIGRNRYAITTQLEDVKFNDRNTSKIVYRADSSYVLSADESVRRYEQQIDEWWEY